MNGSPSNPLSKEQQASGLCSAHQYPHPGQRDHTPSCQVCYPLTSNLSVKDEVLERFRSSIPLGRPLGIDCPNVEVSVPLRWLAIAAAELAGLKYELDAASSPSETSDETCPNCQHGLSRRCSFCGWLGPRARAEETAEDEEPKVPGCNGYPSDDLSPTSGPEKASVVPQCGNPVMVNTEWYGPCTLPADHQGDCRREVNGT